MFMAAIVGLVFIGTAARADDKVTGSVTGKIVAVDPNLHTVSIEEKNGAKPVKVRIGADTKFTTADGKAVEGGMQGLKTGSTVKIAWEIDVHGNRVGTHVSVMHLLHD
jgi:hypothetical protein